jgi:hypothetical protein
VSALTVDVAKIGWLEPGRWMSMKLNGTFRTTGTL